MTGNAGSRPPGAMPPERRMVDAVRDLPSGLVARAAEPQDVDGLTAVVRETDIAGCGHSSTNSEELRDYLADPECGWGRGAVTVWRGPEIIGGLLTFDGLAVGRGWMLDVHAKPSDPRLHGILAALIDAAIREGRTRFELLFPGPDEPMQLAKAGCYSNDEALRSELEKRGFREVRTFWRMKVDHATGADALDPQPLQAPLGTSRAEAGAIAAPLSEGYRIRPFRDEDSDWHGVHEASSAAFLDHFDFTPLEFDEWQERHQGETEDPTQWIVAESDDGVVGYAMGSNRYASEDCGYVASLGVVREHRGHGLARALLRARMADDVARGFLSTILHVDATNPTGATRLYESVGMTVDSEFIGLHRPLFD